MINPSSLAPLKFTPVVDTLPFKAPAAKIGWLHTEADKNGASFDITVRDGLGRVKFERKNCRTETKVYGELVNEPTLVGENLSIEITNLKGADSVSLFLN